MSNTPVTGKLAIDGGEPVRTVPLPWVPKDHALYILVRPSKESRYQIQLQGCLRKT